MHSCALSMCARAFARRNNYLTFIHGSMGLHFDAHTLAVKGTLRATRTSVGCLGCQINGPTRHRSCSNPRYVTQQLPHCWDVDQSHVSRKPAACLGSDQEGVAQVLRHSLESEASTPSKTAAVRMDS